MWYRDGAAAWDRLKNRLALNKLVFKGQTAPSEAAVTKSAIKDLALLAQQEGADVSSVATKALSFSNIVSDLEKLGIIKPSDAQNSSASPGPSLDKNRVNPALSSAFHKEVRIFPLKFK